MKSIGLAIVAALTAAVLSAPLSASAASKPEPYSRDQITAGVKDAPAVVQTVGLPCTVVNASFIGDGTSKNPDDPKSKPLKVKSYEVACQQGMGYIVQTYESAPPKIFDCILAAGSPIACRLPENGDLNKMARSLVSATGKTCTVNNERALGATPAGDRFFEVGCSEGAGFIIKAPTPTSSAAPTAEDCAREVGGNLECKFTTKEQIQAAMTAKMNTLIAASQKPCQLSNSREMGQDASGTAYYEVACSQGVGYIITEKNGQYLRAIDCANASALAGGCTLTDVTKAQTAEAGTYTTLAKASGYPCTVAEYRYIGMDSSTKSEVVELKCSNRSDGVIAFFPADNSKGRFLDCVQAGSISQSCKLSTDQTPLYAKYTQGLASKGKTTCKVSNARGVPGQTKEGNTFIETACSDGLPGYVMVMTPTGSVNELLTCGQAKAAGVACALPGNTK